MLEKERLKFSSKGISFMPFFILYGVIFMIMSYIVAFMQEFIPISVGLVALKVCMDIARNIVYGKG